MANFPGFWKQDDCDPINAEEFIKATGVPEDLAARSIKMRYDVDIKIDGKKWTMNIETTTEPIRKFTIEFTVGVPYEARDMFGRLNKMISIVESDNVIKETCTESNNSVINIIREVKGDHMTNTFTCNGVSMYTSFTRE